MASCPECDAEIEVDELDEFDVDLGDRLRCSTCGVGLEVVNVAPIELTVEPADGSGEPEGDEPVELAFLDGDEDDELDE